MSCEDPHATASKTGDRSCRLPEPSLKILSVPPHLLYSIPDVGKKFELRFTNLERWQTHRKYLTLDFQMADEDTEKQYDEMKVSLAAYYSELIRRKTGRIRTKDLGKAQLAVAYVGDGRFERVIIKIQPGPKVKPNSSGPNGIPAPRPRTAEERVKRILKFGDSNTCADYSREEHKLFYMVEQFARLPFKTMQLFLEHTDYAHSYGEFRDAFCDTFNETEVFEAEIMHVNKRRVPFVILRSSRFSETVNTIVQQKTIASFKEPKLSEVGARTVLAEASHIDCNGDIYLHVNLESAQLLKADQHKIKESQIEALMAEGPYEINPDTIYLHKFDNEYSRCKISPGLSKDEKTEWVCFIDYGNYDLVEKDQLVPCSAVCKLLESFHPQAIYAHLANISELDLDKFYEKFCRTSLFSVETFRAATSDSPPAVQLSHFDPKPSIKLNQYFLDNGIAKAWDEPFLDSKTQTSVKVTCYNAIDMREIRWAGPEGPVSAEPGAILDCSVSSVLGSAELVIRPVGAIKQLTKLEQNITKDTWHKYVEMQREAEVRLRQELTRRPAGRLDYLTHYRDRICLTNGSYFAFKHEDRAGGLPVKYVNKRIRLVGDGTKCTKDEDVIRVLLVDHGVYEDVPRGSLHYLNPEFSRIPPQAAYFHFRGENGVTNPVLKTKLFNLLTDKRVLVKVASSNFNPDTERCEIEGDIYPLTALGPGYDLAKPCSLSSVSAENIKLGMPILTPEVAFQKGQPTPAGYTYQEFRLTEELADFQGISKLTVRA